MTSLLNAVRNYLHGDGAAALPEMELLLFIIGIFVIDRWMKAETKYWNPLLALAGTGFSGYTLWILRARIAPNSDLVGLHETLLADSSFLFFAALLLATTAMVILSSADFSAANAESPEGKTTGNYFALLLFACVSMMLMVSAINLATIFVALELTFFAFFVLMKHSGAALTSGKAPRGWLVFGTLGSLLLGCGFILLYHHTGSANIGAVANMLEHRARASFLIGTPDRFSMAAFGLCATGLLCKMGPIFATFESSASEDKWSFAIPAFANTALIAAVFALSLRLFFVMFGIWFSPSQKYQLLFMEGLAIALLLSGNIFALLEKGFSRILRWSMLSHAGFLLLGVVAANEKGLTASTFYLFAYIFIMTGAFAVAVISRANKAHQPSEAGYDLCGLSRRNPMLAAVLLLFLLALTGAPLTAGFLGKYSIIKTLLETRHLVLAVIAAISVLPGCYYYLRIGARAWLLPPLDPQPLPVSMPQAFVLTVAAFVSLAAGLYSEPFLRLARYAFGF